MSAVETATAAGLDETIALTMIVRDDAVGLERAVLSIKDQVDEIVIGVDARSDEDTWNVAQKLGTTVYRFNANDLGMSYEDWAKNRIDFAAARNLAITRSKSSWILTLDSDEYLLASEQMLRDLAHVPDIDGWLFTVTIGGTNHVSTRLTRRALRWNGAVHNYFEGVRRAARSDFKIVHDTSKRADERQKSRLAQRDDGIELLREEMEKGNLHAHFHYTKHVIGVNRVDEALALVDDFRKRAFPHQEKSEERYWLAFALAFVLNDQDRLVDAELWAIRSLLDGPRVEVFCLLGDIAEGRGDLQEAMRWYEAACAMTPLPCNYSLSALTDLREGRLAGLKMAVAGKHPTQEQQPEKLEKSEEKKP